ncbi:MAG: geranylgeranyl reductase family protein [Chloroflexi bacterium]|nr:geranylgeranyl reductase family protein [Chloroflexota bacterium]
MYDVVIVGAGPGGSATAHFLAQGGLDVLLLDKAEFPRDKTCGDALSPRALAVIDEMGLKTRLRQYGAASQEVEFVAPNGRSVHAHIPKHAGLSSETRIVPRFELDNLLFQRTLESGVTSEQGVHVTGVEIEAGKVTVQGRRKGKQIAFQAQLLVIATGASSKLLLQLGILEEQPQTMLASRVYYKDIQNLPQRLIFRYDDIVLPAYNWIFPVSSSSANIGAGFFRVGANAHKMPKTSQTALEKFLQTSSLKSLLKGARQSGPVKGYPLRVDFSTARTYDERIIIVGEAAGLVNPLTGEGIDYSLESAQIAAEFICDAFMQGEFSAEALSGYDALLREQFQDQFVANTRIRDLFFGNAIALNSLMKAMSKDENINQIVLNIALGQGKAKELFHWRMLARLLRYSVF